MRWMPWLIGCVGLALLTGLVLYTAGPWRTPPWLNGLFLLSVSGTLALGLRVALQALRRHTEKALAEAEHAATPGREPPHTCT